MTGPLSLIPGGVATPLGFRAAGVSAGIKASGNPDLMLLVADAPVQVAAVFTTNKVIAAPVIVSKEHLVRSGGTARAIVVNSGCANACTGDAGLRDAREMAAETARLVGCPVEQVLGSSTAGIGVTLPMASGASGVVVDEAGYGAFVEGLTAVCRELALAIVRGGEGATKLVAVNVTGAATSAEARKAAKVIANSLLVKTAIHGGDPNWGRLICAAGRAGVTFDASRATVTMGSLVLFKDGQPHDDRAPAAAEYLKGSDLTIGVDLGSGAGSSTVWTCDRSAEYVRINADYRT